MHFLLACMFYTVLSELFQDSGCKICAANKQHNNQFIV